jgi:hypothetical protein
MLKGKSSLIAQMRFPLILGGIFASAFLFGIAADHFFNRPAKQFGYAFLALEIAALISLFAIQDLLRGKMKMERFGHRATYDRTNITYWANVIASLGLSAYLVWRGLTVLLR